MTRSHLTVFSPLGRVPLSTTKTADSSTAGAGGTDGYTITIHNPNIVAVALDSITDSLPAGFSYTPGSTTGATTANPSISSQDLSWSGPISVPASGDASIHFNATVASTPGEYLNNAGGTAAGFTVVPTGATAAITVTAGSRTLTVTRAGTGTGTVTSSPTGIDCGSTCVSSFDDGTPVTLTATAGTGSTFTGWSGDCSGTGTCPVTMNADHAVTATFSPTVTDVPDAPTNVTADPGDASALVSWTAPASDGGRLIDGYTVTCTATANPDDIHTATTDGATSVLMSGLTNDVEYSCVVTAHNVNGDSDPSETSPPFTPTASSAQFSTTIDTSQGGILQINPQGADNLGTRGRINILPQPGPATEVVVTASLFGIPGETDASCGGNVCIGQGIEWSISDPNAVGKMKVVFIESPTIAHGEDVKTANVYKDDVLLPNCTGKIKIMCVFDRERTDGGGSRFTIKVDGQDPHGRH